ncbi:MAG: CBS domain-containing protein [Acidobacteriota bacterium]
MSVDKTFQFDKIRHLDLPAPVCVNPQNSLGVVLARMQQARISCVLVCEGKKLQGIFTTRDVLNKVIDCGVDPQTTISTFMTSTPTTLSSDASIAEAIQLMDSASVRHVPLVDVSGEVTGMISADHIVHYLVEHFPTEVYNLPPRLQQKIMTPEGA